ncbi:hypothetical protein SAMN06272771_5288 [Streptomyces sp. Ag82_O1-12]|nr:hypothetical protein SAMN06272771_5288 [Streptomyces sp. Ag82_O1-12]SOD47867.1 hypothetical protein SAMN06272727_5290 [Streptomyces sp. Ag82_G6-1]
MLGRGAVTAIENARVRPSDPGALAWSAASAPSPALSHSRVTMGR